MSMKKLSSQNRLKSVVQPKPKLSVIIPCKNGMPYLRFTMSSVLASPDKDLEILISVDSSEDETLEFVLSLNDSRIKVVQPDMPLSMSEHWDFAQSKASGLWQMFLGQDDLLMTGYSEAISQLVKEATKRSISAIVCRRAYVCWPPVSDSKLKALQYWHSSELTLRSSLGFVREALSSEISYHVGPQMYTSSIVSKSTLDQIRGAQNGALLLGHPQDAFLAASILKACDKYLFSGKPFSWVGTSEKSAGLAITSRKKSHVQHTLAQNYLQSIKHNKKLAHSSPVDFSHGVNSRYFFDALLMVWPGALQELERDIPGFVFGVDVNIAASCVKSGKPLSKFKSLSTQGSFVTLKFVLGIILYLRRLIAASLLGVTARLFRPLLVRRTGLRMFNLVEDPEVLLAQALAVDSQVVTSRKTNRSNQ